MASASQAGIAIKKKGEANDTSKIVNPKPEIGNQDGKTA
jgi:hypothetical protein